MYQVVGAGLTLIWLVSLTLIVVAGGYYVVEFVRVRGWFAPAFPLPRWAIVPPPPPPSVMDKGDPTVDALKTLLAQRKAEEATAPRLRIRLANALQGPDADCEEPTLDCAKLIITNDDEADFTVSVGLRVEGASERVWLVRDGSREREFTIHANDHVRIPLFVRSRRDAVWNVHQAHGNRAQLSPGPCYVFDEAFQLSGTPSTILSAGRHFLAIDVLAHGRKHPATAAFNVFVPDDPNKTLWFDRA